MHRFESLTTAMDNKYFMQHIALLFAFFYVSFPILLSQDILISTQAEVDGFSTNYPGLSTVSGFLKIEPASGEVINNLAGLSQVTRVDGDLLVVQNISGITSLNGLDNILYVGGDLKLIRNLMLLDLSALNAVETVVGELFLENNDALTSINGFNSLKSVGDNLTVRIHDNATSCNAFNQLETVSGFLIFSSFAMETIEDFNSLTTLGGLYISETSLLELPAFPNITSLDRSLTISSCWEITNISGLSSIQTIGGYLQLADNFKLESLEPLINLSFVDGYLEIYRNRKLTTLNGLDNLTAINGRFSIGLNNLLTDISGIRNIDATTISTGQGTLISDFRIFNNPLLTNCAVESVCDFMNSSNDLTRSIVSNGDGCSSEVEIITSCSVLPIQYLSFTATGMNNKTVSLNWQVSDESDVEIFNIEYSTNGYNYQRIGSVSPAESGRYSFKHQSPQSGINYYRVHGKDFSGGDFFSNVESVSLVYDHCYVFPNPSSTSRINVKGVEERFEFRILSTSGEEVMSGLANNSSINVETLSSGIYFLIVDQNGSSTTSFRFVLK